MSDYASIHGPSAHIGGFTLPLIRSGRGNTLTVGRGVSVYYDQQPKYLFGEHAHPDKVQILLSFDEVEAILSWVLRGVQERHGMGGPFVWIVPAGVPHAMEWRGNGDMVVLYAEPAFVRSICGGDLEAVVVEDLATIARFDLIVWHLAGEFRGLCRGESSGTPLLVESMATLLATNILRHLVMMREAVAPSLPTAKLRVVLEYIDQHMREPITREVLAKLVHLSVRAFGRQFKIRTGLAPRDYLRRRRTIRALELIAENKLNKAAIASEVGFCDQSYMMKQIMRLRVEETAAAKEALRRK